jgi:hypothetical protein
MITLDTRITNFLGSVAFLADKKRQTAMWRDHASNLSSVISMGELYAQFFDDNDIDNFIRDELDSAPLTELQRRSIRAVRDALNEFSKAPGTPNHPIDDADLIDDPEWTEIVRLAQTTLGTFAAS